MLSSSRQVQRWRVICLHPCRRTKSNRAGAGGVLPNRVGACYPSSFASYRDARVDAVVKQHTDAAASGVAIGITSPSLTAYYLLEDDEYHSDSFDWDLWNAGLPLWFPDELQRTVRRNYQRAEDWLRRVHAKFASGCGHSDGTAQCCGPDVCPLRRRSLTSVVVSSSHSPCWCVDSLGYCTKRGFRLQPRW